MPRAAFALVPLLAFALDCMEIASARAADVPQPDTKLVPAEEATPILGHVVDGPDGKDVGRLVNVLVDGNGRPRAAVLDVGGFLGMGNRMVSVEWSALRFDPGSQDHPITTGLTPDQLRAAPEYKGGFKPAAVVVAPSHN